MLVFQHVGSEPVAIVLVQKTRQGGDQTGIQEAKFKEC